MSLVLRAAVVYLALLIIFRLAGRRAMAHTSTFDFVLLLIISEAVQQSLLGSDSSLTGGLLVVLTLVGLDIGLSLVKRRFKKVQKWIEGTPLILVDKRVLLHDRLHKARVGTEDLLTIGREKGLRSLEEIEYAVLETNGGIAIIPKPSNP